MAAFVPSKGWPCAVRRTGARLRFAEDDMVSDVQDVTIRTALRAEYDRARAAYEAWGYHGGILPTDVVFLAERGDEVLGIVRRSVEYDTVMLRGMQVDP